MADVYASFLDPDTGAYGEIREWVEATCQAVADAPGVVYDCAR